MQIKILLRLEIKFEIVVHVVQSIIVNQFD
jgi:hypothetical protein